MGEAEILIVAGEASGDNYGADLVRAARAITPSVRFFGLGGDRMAAAGVELLGHLRDVSVMGFVEVLGRLGPLWRTYRALVEAARRRRPRAALFIDFPDFNLRLAPRVRAVSGATTVYYIGPTVWAWRPGRVRVVRSGIDRMLVIFPFEEPIYRQAGVPVEFVGHPLVGSVRAGLPEDEFRRRFGIPEGAPLVGLLPGSRRRELELILPPLAAAGRELARRHGVSLALGLAASVDRRQAERLLGDGGGGDGDGGAAIRIVEGATYDLMRHATLLLTASGTAPLEAALLGTPQVVVYRTAPTTFAVARRLVRVPHVCIVNLVLGRRALPELIQHDLTPERVVAEAERLLRPGPERDGQVLALAELERRLGRPGAAERAARALLGEAGLVAVPAPAGAA
jgi:lipid-A-disaccharide synthase